MGCKAMTLMRELNDNVVEVKDTETGKYIQYPDEVLPFTRKMYSCYSSDGVRIMTTNQAKIAFSWISGES